MREKRPSSSAPCHFVASTLRSISRESLRNLGQCTPLCILFCVELYYYYYLPISSCQVSRTAAKYSIRYLPQEIYLCCETSLCAAFTIASYSPHVTNILYKRQKRRETNFPDICERFNKIFSDSLSSNTLDLSTTTLFLEQYNLIFLMFVS